MIKKLFILILLLTFSFRIWQSSGCQQFLSYTFLPIAVTIRVEEQVSNDKNIPRNVSRVFHNKISEGLYEMSKSYAKIFNPRLLLSILGPLGFFILIASILKIKNTKNRYYFAHLLISTTLPLLSLAQLNGKFSLYILAASFYSFCIWGIDFFTKSKIKQALFILLALLSFFYFSYNWQMPEICNEIFFN